MAKRFLAIVAILSANATGNAALPAAFHSSYALAAENALGAKAPSHLPKSDECGFARKFEVEAANRGVVILTGKATNRVLEPVRPSDPERIRREGFDWFPGLKNPACGITGSGIATYTGTARPAIHCFTIVEKATGKAMKWYVQAASKDNHFMTRSAVGWDGEYISGLAIRATMRARDQRSVNCVEGKKVREVVGYEYDRVTACIQVQFPEDPEVKFIFVSFDDQGRQLPAFPGRTPFAEYVKQSQTRDDSRKK